MFPQPDPGEFHRLKSVTAEVEGWLRDDEAAFLYSAAYGGPGEGSIVEIGSWKGKSTIWLASGSKAAGREKVYAIDPHTGSAEHGSGIWTFPEFEGNIRRAGVADRVVPLVMTSEQAVACWSGPVRLLWIDGAHEYDAVSRDFKMWEPYLIEGGVVALHDTIGWFVGPRTVAVRSILRSGRFHNCGIVGITTYGRKARSLSAVDVLRNWAVLAQLNLLELGGRR
ncbi:MAG: class I SAM-dependent methyltransferase [Armatimonadetes bacterium]|nr:class I SAM-dependent methyltransferase [Armatimonadota bacterium]